MAKPLQSGFSKDSSVIPSVDLSIPMPGDSFPSSANLADVQEISVGYDEINDSVIVTPEAVRKGTTVRFKDPKGSKLRIVFLSPNGKEVETVSDSESYKLTTGGSYHFKCFFTLPGASGEVYPKSGGVIDVMPRRP